MTPQDKLAAAQAAQRAREYAAVVRAEWFARGVDPEKLRDRVERRPLDAGRRRAPRPGCPTCRGTGSVRVEQLTPELSVWRECTCTEPRVSTR